MVVAIDFGTTSSGYAYSFTKEPECIHVMRYASEGQGLAPVTCHCGDLGAGSGGGERESSNEQMNGT